MSRIDELLGIEQFRKKFGSGTVTVFLTQNMENVILKVDYMKGKFVTEKCYQNTYDGREEMENKKKQFQSESDIKKYFGIK